MRYFRLIALTGFLCLLGTAVFAQKKTPPKKVGNTFQGTLIKKPWSKSTQSFCAQGSEYYVLQMKNEEEIVIQNESGQELADFEGKAVKITGAKQTKVIPPSNNPMEQRPVDPFSKEDKGFTCTVLVAKKIQ